MFKQLICLSLLVATTQMAFAAPNQYEAINKGYDLTCESKDDGEKFSSKLDLIASSSDTNTYLYMGIDFLGCDASGLSNFSFPLQEQKYTDYNSQESADGTNYIETKFIKNQISYKKTNKPSGLFTKEQQVLSIKIDFLDSSLTAGVLEVVSNRYKTSKVAICSFRQRKD